MLSNHLTNSASFCNLVYFLSFLNFRFKLKDRFTTSNLILLCKIKNQMKCIIAFLVTHANIFNFDQNSGGFHNNSIRIQNVLLPIINYYN